ncbi:MAG: hypothetical protein AAB795_03660 [Patescibacteria group bacterium]
MKININKTQYENIVKALEISSFVYGNLSDFVDEKYKKDVNTLENVQKDLLEHAKEFHFNKNTENFEGKIILREEYYEKLLDDLFLYDDHQLFENLANKLGWRDFKRKFTKEEIEKMSEKYNGYLGVPIYDFEKKYYDEFNKHEYDRLEVKE